ncbi:MAG: sigma-70 family RNA polymerase sigma factor [Chloroflexi bacterium]|nr:sigma-70 family RNA polymerase sigma factor [Chloroflexota bacterium]
MHLVAIPQSDRDEDLMGRLAAGQQDALVPLYSRYAPLVLSLAAQSLGRPGAEEIVQDVFLAVWKQAGAFDPERGTFRSWVLQIAHYRTLNELRRLSRRPRSTGDPDALGPDAFPDHAPEPAEVVWREFRRSALREAFEQLPSHQKQALGLAYFGDLTHEQVAMVLNLPLGTAKTRIRAGLQHLRSKLGTVVAALAVGGTLAYVGIRYQAQQATLQQDDRALALVTSSDTQSARLTAAPGVPPEAHATYRGRPGADIAILTSSYLPPTPRGQIYRAWAHIDGAWVVLGTVTPDADGSVRLIVEGTDVAAFPDALQITVEASAQTTAPSGPIVVAWPSP